ncbi:pyridoxamine 5'-phosphate oxidase family protein [Sphingomicrobium aestuariivivum]|uniref:pyridoxamine 5'-phosphate oxidase family protein n=1 Tax=Sphingomicrobium aestuariivivum TaxID=1582356 RepID=UPI001FD695F8|nr:pyridoxamine 5'-phosphate oxidase family protein [Sphingomicrobium aestuariivivum]MCJ8191325.1 pyridoxamine 5'-phosphate oxidase family protein [Sphingomicrobium aestuariivivum]
MLDKALSILRDNRLMSIATLREDGWPQVTMVAYAHDGMRLYFVVSKRSQKFRNISADDRVSATIGRDVIDPVSIKGLSIAGHAKEVTDAAERDKAIDLLIASRPALKQLDRPDPHRAAVMAIDPDIVTVLDYSESYGNATMLERTEEGDYKSFSRADDWGYGSTFRPAD